MADVVIDKIIEDLIDKKLEDKSTKVVQSVEKAALKVSADLKKSILEEMSSFRQIEFTMNGKKNKSKALHHKSFEEILRYIATNISMILVGPAGSGKTQIAVQCAEMLDRTHYSISVNEHTSKTDFLGYMDAMGKIVKTNFREAYENGGVFIIDEIDCANPNILTIINSALSNGFCPFPDGMVSRHKDFLCICTANTFGEGESAHYIGRNILDAATRDRFATVHVDYDENIERHLNNELVYNLAIELRQYFKTNNIDFIISTRGMLRLSGLLSVEDYVLTMKDIKNCLNLHTIGNIVDPILTRYAQ